MLPAGLSSADFYYLLPEIVLTIGSMLVLGADRDAGFVADAVARRAAEARSLVGTPQQAA